MRSRAAVITGGALIEVGTLLGGASVTESPQDPGATANTLILFRPLGAHGGPERITESRSGSSWDQSQKSGAKPSGDGGLRPGGAVVAAGTAVFPHLLGCFNLVWESEALLHLNRTLWLLRETRGSHPERVVLLGQVGQDVGVEQSRVQEAAPERSQPGAELAHVPADLLRHLLVVFLALVRGGEERSRR